MFFDVNLELVQSTKVIIRERKQSGRHSFEIGRQRFGDTTARPRTYK